MWPAVYPEVCPKRQVAIGLDGAHTLAMALTVPLPPCARAPDARALTVWYDGGCPLCLREIAVMRRLDRAGRIGFVDLADGAQACPLDRRLMLERLHVREGGVILSGAAGFAAMWRAIPVLRPLGELARVPPVLWLMERAYRGFLRLRPRLQGWLR